MNKLFLLTLLLGFFFCLCQAHVVNKRALEEEPTTTPGNFDFLLPRVNTYLKQNRNLIEPITKELPVIVTYFGQEITVQIQTVKGVSTTNVTRFAMGDLARKGFTGASGKFNISLTGKKLNVNLNVHINKGSFFSFDRNITLAVDGYTAHIDKLEGSVIASLTSATLNLEAINKTNIKAIVFVTNNVVPLFDNTIKSSIISGVNSVFEAFLPMDVTGVQ
eukprot:Pgem_evm1s18044